MPKKGDQEAAIRAQQSASTMKGAFVAILMIPVVVALGAGIYIATQDPAQGVPLLLGGVVLAVFNALVLRYLFARLAKMEAEERSAGQGPA